MKIEGLMKPSRTQIRSGCHGLGRMLPSLSMHATTLGVGGAFGAAINSIRAGTVCASTRDHRPTLELQVSKRDHRG